VLVITPNLTFDITVALADLVPGTVSRADSTITSAGGKGVNVVRAATALGGTNIRLLGFLPQDDGDRLADYLAGEHIELIGVPLPGAVRVATVILERSGRVSVINGPGPQVLAEHWAALMDRVAGTLTPGEVIACSGSLPPGAPADGYAQIAALGHANGCPVIVDAAPTPLRAALAKRPDLVSPNLSEAEAMLFGRTDEVVDEVGPDVPVRALTAARALHQAGAARAVVTAGGSGAALCTADGGWWLPAQPVRVVSPIGAGDSFVGAAGLALAAGENAVDVVRAGMAGGSASCETAVAGRLDPARAAAIRAAITPVPAADLPDAELPSADAVLR
jgi:1-phosphofructokinase family hexose kinase